MTTPRPANVGRRRTPPPLSRLARTPRAAEASGLSRRTLYRLAQDGLLTRWKVRGATFWDLDEISTLARPAGEVTRAAPRNHIA